MIVALIALFIALGGGAYALTLPKNSVKSKHIKDGQVRNPDIGNGAVSASKIAPGIIQTPPGQTPPGGTLPAGVTLKGVWAPQGERPDAGTIGGAEGVSFGGYTLASRPTAHVIPVGGSATTECPGSVAAPGALSGHLCLYVAKLSGGTATTGERMLVIDPISSTTNGIDFNLATNTSITVGDGKVSTLGYKVTYVDGYSNISQGSGAWAVTG
jgi:hypothetical protein